MTPPTAVTPAELNWYRRLYLRLDAASSSPYALWTMLLVSVVDGSVFPIPPFVVLIPMVLAEPRKWWRFALVGTLASMGGGLIGYYIGTLIHSGAASLFHIDLNAQVDRFGIHRSLGQLLGDNFWVLALLCSVLPTPFKIVAIGSGIVSVPLGRFLLAAAIGRTVRFFLVAGVMRFVGPTARKWIRA